MTDYKAKVTHYSDYGYGQSDTGEFWSGTITDGDCINLRFEWREEGSGSRIEIFQRRLWKPDGKRFYHSKDKEFSKAIAEAIDAAIAEVGPIVSAAISNNHPEECIDVDFTGETPIVKIDNHNTDEEKEARRRKYQVAVEGATESDRGRLLGKGELLIDGKKVRFSQYEVQQRGRLRVGSKNWRRRPDGGYIYAAICEALDAKYKAEREADNGTPTNLGMEGDSGGTSPAGVSPLDNPQDRAR